MLPAPNISTRDTCASAIVQLQVAGDISASVLLVKWVKHYGSEYRPGLIVCLEFSEELPVFCKISTIIVR